MIDVLADGDRGVRTVTLDRPDRRNALALDGLAELEAALEATTEPVCLLRGAGEAFCAGADLDDVAALSPADARELAERGQRVARTLETSEAVTVAGVDGAAVGGGLELALACDVRVATPRSTFGEPGVGFGLFGAWGGTVRLPRLVGESVAMDLALSGRPIDAERAREVGLVSRVVDDPEPVATEIAANPPETLAAVAARVRDRADRETQERRETATFVELVETHAERLRELRE